MAGLGPARLQRGPVGLDHRAGPGTDHHGAVGAGRAQVDARQPAERRLNRRHVGGAHLHHRAEFLREQRRQHLAQRGHVEFQTATAGEGHLQHAGEQPAIGPVVVGQQAPRPVFLLNGLEEPDQVRRIVEIRRHVAELAVHLGQRAAAEAVAAPAQVHQQQAGVAGIQPDLRRQGTAGICHRRERRHDQGQRRADLPVFPARAHGQAVLAHRHGDAQRRAQLHADRPDGIEQRLLVRVAAHRGHPVGGQHGPAEFRHVRRTEIGDRLGDGHARRRRGIEQREGRPLAHGEGFAAQGAEARQGHGHVGHRHLPGSDHLFARHQTGDAAITDGDEELLAGDRRKPQHPVHRFGQLDAAQVEDRTGQRPPFEAPLHPRRFAEQHGQRQVHRRVVEHRVRHRQVRFRRGFAHHGEGAALALTDSLEAGQRVRRNGQDVALLGLVAPDLQR